MSLNMQVSDIKTIANVVIIFKFFSVHKYTTTTVWNPVSLSNLRQNKDSKNLIGQRERLRSQNEIRKKFIGGFTPHGLSNVTI